MRVRNPFLLTLLSLPSLLGFNSKKGAPPTNLHLLGPTNGTQLREVFFSGQPWLVQCANEADLAAASVDQGLGSHEVVEIALNALQRAQVSVGLLDCALKLPSGKSAIDRFKLDASISPMLVFVANGEAPTQIVPSMLSKAGNSRHLFPSPRQQAAALLSLVKARSTHKAFVLTKTEHLHTSCLQRKHCVLLLSPGEPKGEYARTLNRLLQEFRSIAFGTINTARYDFSLAKHLPKPPTPKQPNLVALHSSRVENEPKKMTLGAKAHRGEFSLEALRPFLTDLTSDALELTPLKRTPSIAWRKQEGKAGKSSKGDGGKGARTGGNGATERPSSRSSSSRAERSADKSAKSGRASTPGGGRSAARSDGGGGDRGSGGSGGGLDEAGRRSRISEEMEEAVKGLFDDDEGEGSEEDEEESAGVLDLDEDEDAEEIFEAEDEALDEATDEEVDSEFADDGADEGTAPAEDEAKDEL